MCTFNITIRNNKKENMTKNNLKVVKTDNKKDQELKEKNKSLEAENNSIQENLDQLIKKINILISLIKSNYED